MTDREEIQEVIATYGNAVDAVLRVQGQRGLDDFGLGQAVSWRGLAGKHFGRHDRQLFAAVDVLELFWQGGPRLSDAGAAHRPAQRVPVSAPSKFIKQSIETIV